MNNLWHHSCTHTIIMSGEGAGHSSGGKAPIRAGFDYPIDSTQWVHSQLGIFSVPTSGSELVPQRLWYMLSYLWESVYK